MPLDATNRTRVGNQYQRDQSTLCAYTKPQLVAAVAAVDDWIDTNTTSLNNALPAAFRNAATAPQKALLYAYVFMRRAGVLRAQEDG
jgi:hypothetical protein